MYDRRFADIVEYRKKMYAVLCKSFFQKFIPQDSVILDIAAGYCEFVNNIIGSKKIALDMNPDVSKYAEKGTDISLPLRRYVKTSQSTTIMARGSKTAQVSPSIFWIYLDLKSLAVRSYSILRFKYSCLIKSCPSIIILDIPI